VASEKPALAAHLDAIRRERRYSIRELAELAQINYSYVSKILAGRHIPSVGTLQKLADALQAPLMEMLELYENLPHQMLTRLVSEHASVRHRAPRGASSQRTTDEAVTANLPPAMAQALREIAAQGRGAQGIADVLQSIAQVEPADKREELIAAIAALVKCYVGREGGPE